MSEKGPPFFLHPGLEVRLQPGEVLKMAANDGSSPEEWADNGSSPLFAWIEKETDESKGEQSD